MSRTSKTKPAVPVRKKKPTSKGEALEKSLLPTTGNVSVTVNVIWPSEASAAPKELSSVVGPWIWTIIRHCLNKVWMIFR